MPTSKKSSGLYSQSNNYGEVLCPLSGSSNVVLLEKVKTKDLVTIYNRTLNMNISSEFNGLDEIGFYHCADSDLTFFAPPVNGSTSFYNNLQQFDWYYMDEKNEYSFAKQFIQQSDFVIEIGCGKGAFAQKILSENYMGLELNKTAAMKARKSGITVLTQQVEDFAVSNSGRYDVVCAFQVLEHISAINTFIKACVDCLKPGGLLIYSVPSQDSFSIDVPNFTLDMPPHHVSRWSDLALRNIANYFPLKIDQIWHEPLQEVHKTFYSETILRNALIDIFGISKRTIVDLRLSTRMISVLSKLLGRMFARGLSRDELLPRGISVVAIYRKI